MKTRILSLTLMVSFLLLLSSTAQAGGHIDPSGFTATSSSEHASFYGPEFVINGAGLIGGTFPNELHHGGHIRGHSNSAEQIWLSLEPTDDPPFGTWFKVDLGRSYALEEVIVWNGSFRGGNSGLGTTDSLKQGDIYYSNSAADPGDDLSAAGWTLFGTAGDREFAQLINNGADFGPTETIPLGFTAQWFAIDVNSNYGYGDWTALAELQFIESEAIASDLNDNGFVDFEDLTILLANWNKDVTAEDGNLVEPLTTVVNFADLTVLLADWTGPGPAGSPEAALGEAVPEPSTVLLAAIAALGLSFYRRRRQRV